MSSDLPSNNKDNMEEEQAQNVSKDDSVQEATSYSKGNEETESKGEEQKDPFLEKEEQIPPPPSTSSISENNITNQPESSTGENSKEINNEMEEEEEEEDENSTETNGRTEENSNAEEEEIDSVTGEKRKRTNDDDWKPSSPGSSQINLGKKKIKKIPLKKKPKIKKIPEIGESEGEKLSFQRKSLQEAAVQVLGEQREKGVYALSTRRIWELISLSGLVDTKCKTPVSSLSSRITEDVRTKGNKSVFVRVGEGLYTLRKGLKKQDIERYLNAKYPNMPHGSDLEHQFSEDEHEDSSTNTSSSNNNNNNQAPNPTTALSETTPTAPSSFSDQFAKILQENRENSKEQGETKKNAQAPRQIPVRFTKPPVPTNGNNANAPIAHGNAAAAAAHFVAKAQANANINSAGSNGSNAKNLTVQRLPAVSNVKNSAQEAEKKVAKPVATVPQIKLKEIKWVGLPLKKKKNGDVHYTSVKVENNTFRIGDCVYFEASLHGDEVKDKGTTMNYIGKITKLFQTNSKAKMKAHGGTMLVECVWYFYPEDTRTGRRKKHHKREVFLSNLTDVNNVNTIRAPVQVLSFPDFNQTVNSPANSAEEIPPDIFFCRSFYDEVSTTFHPFSLDYKTGNFHFSDVINHAQNRVKNWPKEVEFTCQSIWGEISGGVKELLDTKHKPYVKIEALNALNKENNAAISTTNALFAATFLSEGMILGDFQGVVVNNTEEATSHHDPNGSIRTLYEDHEVMVSIDYLKE
eukprot:TRINITY_DN802_c0_g1_i5.p1 TRINITY_DN802_c0_g1~~TRINITY_DN802_c0_g1_i5.p1  ORF type:complete len:747 (-),score=289.50 TRINITY_DN802_c0_g1_i5:884-3124(-)